MTRRNYDLVPMVAFGTRNAPRLPYMRPVFDPMPVSFGLPAGTVDEPLAVKLWWLCQHLADLNVRLAQLHADASDAQG